MKKFSEFITESNIVKVETFKGFESYTEDDIKDMVDNPADYSGSDNLPKWLEVAMMNSKLSAKKRKTAVQNILQDILNKNVKEIKFMRDNDKNIIGFSNLSLRDYS